MAMGTSDLIILLGILIPLSWWIFSSISVGRFLKTKSPAWNGETPEPLSLFKPLPPLKNDEERNRYAASIGSFSKQMLAGDEILLRCQETEKTFWMEKATEWETGKPGLKIRVVTERLEDGKRHANPKIDAMAVLAPHATHDLWWWSDADITIPRGELAVIRAEYGKSKAVLQTQAYVIPQIRRREDWLDAMFVHIELLPGLTLLASQPSAGFACGGSLLFRRQEFEKRIQWQELGGELADDYFLGQKMQPVRLGRSLMQTESGEEGMLSSWQHYFRWQKTVRWCHPAGFAGLFFLQPVCLVLAAALAGLVLRELILLGLILHLMEALWVTALFRRLEIKSSLNVFWITPLWSVVRSATWLLCWFPVAIHWSGIKWWKSKTGSVGSGGGPFL